MITKIAKDGRPTVKQFTQNLIVLFVATYLNAMSDIKIYALDEINTPMNTVVGL